MLEVQQSSVEMSRRSVTEKDLKICSLRGQMDRLKRDGSTASGLERESVCVCVGGCVGACGCVREYRCLCVFRAFSCISIVFLSVSLCFPSSARPGG